MWYVNSNTLEADHGLTTLKIGSWYRKSELGRRSALFVISGVLGQMFSGYLQSAL